MIPGVVYHPASRYRWLALACAAAFAALLGVALWRRAGGPAGLRPDELFFLALLAGLGLWNLRLACSRVLLNAEGLALHMPAAQPRLIAYRQLLSVSEEGRSGRLIAVVYYPLREDGLLDLDAALGLALPAVAEQEALLAALQERVPR